MPKVSDDYLQARRAEIIDAASTAFAEHGFTGTTVAVLEEATGLSRGAIFNYFEDKDDLFLAVAEARTEQIMHALTDRDPIDAVRVMAEQDPAIVGAFVEAAHRVRTDPAFGARYVARGTAAGEHLSQMVETGVARGQVRDDVDATGIGALLALIVDGLALHIAMLGGPPDDLEAVIGLLEDAIRPR